MKAVAPCKDCLHRKLGCHGRCEAYQTYKAEMEESQRNRQKANDLLDMDIRSAVRRKMAAKRGGKRKLK